MLKLKSLILNYPIIQSPMAGCTDLAFRLIARSKGLEFSYLEMISANGLVRESRGSTEIMKTVSSDRPLGAQLIGCDPDTMGEAAARLENEGFDSLDLNLGCPVRKMVSQGSGAALLKDVKKAETIFKKVVHSVKRIPVSVKMRKGYTDESGEEAVRMAKAAEASGISMVCVHGRTQAQGYGGTADWRVIRRVKATVKIPVIGNGDIFKASDAKRMVDETGCDGVMIGRGGLGNPWLYSQIQSLLYDYKPFAYPTIQERRDTVLKHLNLEIEYEGERKAILHMRRIGSWYFSGRPSAASFREGLNRAQTTTEIKEILMAAFQEEAPESLHAQTAA